MNIQEFVSIIRSYRLLYDIFNVCYPEGLYVIIQLIEGMKPVQFSFYFAAVATCSHRLPVFTESVTIRFENLNIQRQAYPVNKTSKNSQ